MTRDKPIYFWDTAAKVAVYLFIGICVLLLSSGWVRDKLNQNYESTRIEVVK